MLDMKQSWDDLIQQLRPAGTARAHPEEPLLPVALHRAGRSPGVHRAGEALGAAPPARLRGAHRARHAAHRARARLPRRAHADPRLPGQRGGELAAHPALRASRLSLRLALWGGGVAAKTIGRIIGGDTLEELAAFLAAVSGMNERFRERARAVRALLASPETGFLLVAGASPERREEALRFHAVLGERGLQRDGVVVNRVQRGATGVGGLRASTGSPSRCEARWCGRCSRPGRSPTGTGSASVSSARARRRCRWSRFPASRTRSHDLRALWRAGSYLLGEAAIL